MVQTFSSASVNISDITNAMNQKNSHLDRPSSTDSNGFPVKDPDAIKLFVGQVRKFEPAHIFKKCPKIFHAKITSASNSVPSKTPDNKN